MVATAMSQGPQGGMGQPPRGGGQGMLSPGATPQNAPSPGATPPSAPDGQAGPQGGPGAMFTSALDALVGKGAITRAQETAIVAALQSGMPGGGQAQPTAVATGSTRAL